MSGLFARLDETGGRVLCGVRDCRGEIGRVQRWPDREGGILLMGPGWHPRADGVWALGRHAARRVARGQAPRDRRSPLDRVSPGAPLSGVAGVAPGALPIQAKCPRCGQVQEIEPDALALLRDWGGPDQQLEIAPGQRVYTL